jgi:hypothetical protein
MHWILRLYAGVADGVELRAKFVAAISTRDFLRVGLDIIRAQIAEFEGMAG